MSEFEQVKDLVGRAAQRRRWQRGWHRFWQGLLAGGVLWLLCLAVFKGLPVTDEVLFIGGGVALGLPVLGFILGFWRLEKPLQTARWMDDRQRLQERLSTALEVGADPKMGAWGELVVKDAVARVAGLDVRRLLPYHLPGASRWALLVLLLSAGLGFVPEYRSQEYLKAQQTKENIKETGKNLADATRRVLAKRKEGMEKAADKAIKAAAELGGQMAKKPATRADTLKELAKASEKVAQQSKDLERNPTLKSLQKAAQNQARDASGASEQLQSRMEAIQKAMGSKEAMQNAMDKLQKELEKAQQQAASMARNPSEASDAAKSELAKALASLAQQAQAMGAALSGLEEAIASLEAGKISQVAKDLQMAERDLDKLKEMAKAMQQMQQQAMQMGKDLAEQLKNGQAEAAEATLRKMTRQLDSGQITPEQMKAIMDEVAKALKPAEPYGDVAKELNAAMKSLAKGEKQEGAKALAKAADQLADLMQQMADLQDLKSTMASLRRAQMAVGTGMGWGQCQGPPKAGKGGKPGRGVGTWADEGQMMDPPEQEAWDNSGVERPDTDSRGLTDRGEGQLPEGAQPDQVKGQLSPGGQMPTITLKGVSIKGQSTVAIQEAVSAAQSEAQSALSSEQVPKAYQGAVKDYFDDLKGK
jgi:chemotaxis protein histidine kinase CheA